MTGDSSLLKTLNKSTLLRLIRRHAPISRADLAKRTHLTRATVSALVEELIGQRLVAETGIGASSGGRKPVLLQIDAEAGYVIGLDVRRNDLLAIVADLRGNALRELSRKLDAPSDPERTLSQLIALMRELRSELPDSPLGVVGVGVGIAGLVEQPSGRILFVPAHDWRLLDWRERLAEALGVPVIVENEANLAALAEHDVGAAQHATELLYVSVSAGIGAGYIVGGELYRGAGGYAGEVGHTTIELNGRPCSCGNRGCWETYASEQALAEALGLAYDPPLGSAIAERAASGEASALAALERTGVYLGIGIGNMIHTLNPQMIVVGGAISRYRDWLLPKMEATIRARFPYIPAFEVPIRFSELGETATAQGAIAYVLRELLEKPGASASAAATGV
ncbi:ROK family transcriptional regulator [Gordoniibacillus kamchatkensis]|uniref:ROK family transcriptional regulator n=1 Tax=Gordoniibacillus kamchatkensis TaxID=1590651 RepID=UPI0018CDCF64|nr:ROK family transcriptional regulator [Paenibacillus sp. VKM B-2647]